ncbi:MAG: type II toxin-antitoxin system RelE/ParE family toxin [Ignavibacteriaceae bacterium]
MLSNKYQIRILKIAEEDFSEIINFIADDNLGAAKVLADKIEKDLMLLSENPYLGRVPRDEEIKSLGYRYLIVQNYIIFYTIDDSTILVHRILHQARDYKTLL